MKISVGKKRNQIYTKLIKRKEFKNKFLENGGQSNGIVNLIRKSLTGVYIEEHVDKGGD